MGGKKYLKRPEERTQPVTGVTPRNEEELAQSEVECREGKHHVHMLFCPWYALLRLAVQTCVRQRKPRLLLMATFGGLYRVEGSHRRTSIGHSSGRKRIPKQGV